jgi:hypothetical protein
MGLEVEFVGGYLLDGHWGLSVGACACGRVQVGTVGQRLEAAAGGLGGTMGDVYGFYEGGQFVLCVGEGAQGRDAEVVGAAEEDAQRVERV